MQTYIVSGEKENASNSYGQELPSVGLLKQQLRKIRVARGSILRAPATGDIHKHLIINPFRKQDVARGINFKSPSHRGYL